MHSLPTQARRHYATSKHRVKSILEDTHGARWWVARVTGCIVRNALASWDAGSARRWHSGAHAKGIPMGTFELGLEGMSYSALRSAWCSFKSASGTRTESEYSSWHTCKSSRTSCDHVAGAGGVAAVSHRRRLRTTQCGDPEMSVTWVAMRPAPLARRHAVFEASSCCSCSCIAEKTFARSSARILPSTPRASKAEVTIDVRFASGSSIIWRREKSRTHTRTQKLHLLKEK